MNRKLNKLLQSKTAMSVVLTVLVVAASAAVVWGTRQEGKVEESQAYMGENQEDGETQADSYAQDGAEQNNSMAGIAAVGEKRAETDATSGEDEDGRELAEADAEDVSAQADVASGEGAETDAEENAQEANAAVDGEAETEDAEAAANLVNPVAELPYTYFNETSTMQWPLEGNILLDFSMDSTIYYPTLDLYRTNPAILIQAEVGTTVQAPAEGKVVAVDHNEELGDFVVIDMGNGYQAKCGQLTEVPVSAGDIVEAGTVLGQVAEPTKYYVVEGSNLYFGMTRDGVPVDPLDYIR